jgi:hypothetical protein
LEEWLKLAGGVALSLYVIGLTVVNAYLYSLGVSDFALVRPRFIYAGALICGLTALAYLIPRFAANEVLKAIQAKKEVGKYRGWRSYVGPLFRESPGLLTGVIIYYAILLSFSKYSTPKLFGAVITLAIAGYILGAVLGIIADLIQTFAGDQELSIPKVGFLGFSALFAAVLYAGLFMGILYDKIPEQFGRRPSTNSTIPV